MLRGRLVVTAFLSATLLGLLGCGSKVAVSTEVKGRIGYHGGPLPGGVIVFVPDEDRGNNGPLLKGTIMPDGTFSLGATVPPGWYRVAIAPPPSAQITAPTVPNPYPAPSPRYRNPQLSGLQAEVKAETESVFEFELD